MKKLGLTTLFIMPLLVGCGKSNDLPSDCIEMIDSLKELIEISGEKKDKKNDPDRMLQGLKDDWMSFDDAGKDKLAKKCKIQLDLVNIVIKNVKK